MIMWRSIILWGKGGLAREVLSYAQEPLITMVNEDIDSDENRRLVETHQFVFAFSDPKGKSVAYENYKKRVILAKAFNCSAREIPLSSKVGCGSLICPGTVMTCNVRVGLGATINANCFIGHDVRIDDFCSLHPGVIICGHVKVGKRVLFGARSCVRDGVSICDDVVIGMGSVVVKDITEPGTYFGNPCRKASL